MKTTAYKITGILAALSAATALGAAPMMANAQTTANAPVSQQPVPTLPQTTPDETAKSPDAVQAPPATPPAADATTAATPSSTTTTAASNDAAGTVAGPVAKDFIQQAYLANEFGIAASQVAIQQTKNPDTKAAAQAVLTDGMKVRQDMVAAIQGATTDMHFDQSWTDEYKQKLADLQSTQGKAFDQKYLATQGDVTQKSTVAFNEYAQSGTDASVKSFATSSLPRLQADSGKLQAASASVDAEPDAAAAPAAKVTKTSKKTTHTTKGTR